MIPMVKVTRRALLGLGLFWVYQLRCTPSLGRWSLRHVRHVAAFGLRRRRRRPTAAMRLSLGL